MRLSSKIYLVLQTAMLAAGFYAMILRLAGQYLIRGEAWTLRLKSVVCWN